jgi:AraC-like DNA-binding protein
MELQLSTHSETQSGLPAGLPEENLVFHTQNLEEARDKVASIYTSHGLDYKSRKSKLDTWFYHLPLRSASVNYLGYGSDMVVNPGELESFFLIQTPIKGGGDVVCGKQHIITSPLRSSVLNPTLPSKMVWDADCWQAQVRLDRCLVERCLSEMLEKPLNSPVEFDLGMDMSSDPGQVWWNTVQFVADEIPRLKALPGTDLMLRQLEHLLANTLLQIQSHNYSSELAQQQPSIAPRHVKKSEAFIEAHSHEAITIEHIVAASGVSERALYQGFRQFRDLSPMRYLKFVRLQKVHEALRKAAPDDCVTRIASDQGFTQLGRFAVEYREKFGESPSDTLKSP